MKSYIGLCVAALLLAGCPNAPGEPGEKGLYRVEARSLNFGEIIPYPEEGPAGTVIDLDIYADDECQYVPGSLYYRALPEGEPVAIPVSSGAEWANFALPASDVEVGAQFLSLEELSRRMVRVSGKTVNKNTGYAGAPFAGAGTDPVEVKGFTIAATEVPYQLWYTVRVWAEDAARGDKRYIFSNSGAGSEGSSDIMPSEKPVLPSEAHKYGPVMGVSWRSAVIWCNAYSEWAGEVKGENTQPVYKNNGVILRNSRTGWTDPDEPAFDAPGYRLPTEAEWEFAARGGDPDDPAWTYLYPGGNKRDELAWHNGNSDGITHNVGLKAPNTLGLYDMGGNTLEWCWDIHTGTNRVGRGGYFASAEVSLEARAGYSLSVVSLGLRVAGPLD
jgi:formylglycine-generating enzyme required for sulfatase activity